MELERIYAELRPGKPIPDMRLLFAQGGAPYKPVRPSAKPVRPSDKPVRPSAKPVRPSDKPVRPSDKPVRPSAKPVRPSDKPVKRPGSRRTTTEDLAIRLGITILVIIGLAAFARYELNRIRPWAVGQASEEARQAQNELEAEWALREPVNFEEIGSARTALLGILGPDQVNIINHIADFMGENDFTCKKMADFRVPLESREGCGMITIKPNILAICGLHTHIILWNYNLRETVRSLNANTIVDSLCYMEGSMFASTGRDKKLHIWYCEEDQPKASFDNDNAITFMFFMSDKNLLASGDAGGNIVLYTTDRIGVLVTYRGHEHPISGISKMSDDRLASCSTYGTICIFSISSQLILNTINADINFMNLKVTSGTNGVVCDWNGFTYIFDIDNPLMIGSSKKSAVVPDPCILPGGNIVLFTRARVGSIIGTYDLSNKFAPICEKVYGALDQTDIIRCIVLPNGNIATGSAGGLLCIWDTITLTTRFRAYPSRFSIIDIIAMPGTTENSSDFQLAVRDVRGNIHVYA
jgi:WD40 repeat protein